MGTWHRKMKKTLVEGHSESNHPQKKKCKNGRSTEKIGTTPSDSTFTKTKKDIIHHSPLTYVSLIHQG